LADDVAARNHIGSDVRQQARGIADISANSAFTAASAAMIGGALGAAGRTSLGAQVGRGLGQAMTPGAQVGIQAAGLARNAGDAIHDATAAIDAARRGEYLEAVANAVNLADNVSLGKDALAFAKPRAVTIGVANGVESARRRAVRQAWKQEQELVRRTGEGTRKWSDDEIDALLNSGRVPGYQGHHINSVNGHPQLAGIPNNVELVTRAENLLRHRGNWRNPTTGDLLDRSIP
jgi:hypothetical protein